ncbi:ATP-binding protein [Mucilaginibacter aquaedulcis]|uniref:ATP-binding protein n=1 Tax=Mucilaginibacter aquaedulcis TaxID=1187081 RepID=UPI0025B401B8|nr:ATP-binding protein [Mucilaginibacter aquaedulcis]MDN3548921.1 ATP-binding protein [Mucilaginibacter aquaedulcis]
MKQKIKDVEASPSKRIYHSIIADYHLDIALCELIDNALDNWKYSGKKQKLTVKIDLDYSRQIIQISDDSGGLKEDEIQLIVSPGYSKNIGDDLSIGFFGVGSKRAVVALAEEIKIFTRFKKEKTLYVEINDSWISDSSWDVEVFQVDNIAENSTLIELVKLRSPLVEDNHAEAVNHLGATYSQFLINEDFEIILNDRTVDPITFESWSFPLGFEPTNFSGKIDLGTKGSVDVNILGGLTRSGDPSGGEYGAYFYCNRRLIARAYKGSEIGYRQIRIGQPHPSVSLARAIIKINGPASLMPWNSSKSDINIKHPTYIALLEHIDQVLYHYSQLSKKWSTGGGWEQNIFKYKTGDIKEENVDIITASTRIHLPPIPRVAQHKFVDIIKIQNRELAREKPWVKGHYEAIIAVDELPKLKLEQNNRISLLILDSTLEIAFKDYLVNESPNTISETRLSGIMQDRSQVHTEVRKTVRMTRKVWKRIEYYYKLRSELVHKRANVTISNDDLKIFRETVEYALNKMFKLTFKST